MQEEMARTRAMVEAMEARLNKMQDDGSSVADSTRASTAAGGRPAKRGRSAEPLGKDYGENRVLILKGFPHRMWRTALMDAAKTVLGKVIPSHHMPELKATDNSQTVHLTLPTHEAAKICYSAMRDGPVPLSFPAG